MEGSLKVRQWATAEVEYHSPAPPSLQFSSASHSPAPPSLERQPVSSAYYSPATTILQRLLFPSACHSPAPTILQLLPFSSYFVSSHLLSSHFLSCLFTTLFQAVSDGSHYREETHFYYLRRCEGSRQRAYQYLGERRMDEEERNGSHLP